MSVQFIPIPGNLIDKTELEIPKAKEIIAALNDIPYFKFIESRKIQEPYEEIIVFDVSLNITQKIINDIHRIERIAVVFTREDIYQPQVLTLRDDFPQTPHMNLMREEKPKNICLFEESYAVVKLQWTPHLFLNRIRKWLTDAANGELHQSDQNLEPLLLDYDGNLILPHDIFNQKSNTPFFSIKNPIIIPNKINFVAKEVSKLDDAKFILLPLQGEAQQHGVISRSPKNLKELSDLLLKANINLIDILREYLKNLYIQGNYTNIIEISNLMLVVNLPKKRLKDSIAETSEIWAFPVFLSLKLIGIKIGVYQIQDGKIAINLPPYSLNNSGEINVSVLNPMMTLTREIANKLSGISSPETKSNFVLIGVGSLGSQVFMNLIRMGIGKWHIVDNDGLYPHNLVRHILPGNFIGYPKAEILNLIARDIIHSDDISTSDISDVLKPEDFSEQLLTKYKEAKYIIDASATIPVVRYIAKDINSDARRLSIFISPSGKDSILFIEDEKREVPLDCLEMQYYRFIANKTSLKNHLRTTGPIRYARSCRDITTVIPQDLIALHSAICSRSILNSITKPDAQAYIWSSDPDTLTVKCYIIPIYKVIFKKHDKWTLYFDNWLLQKIAKVRLNKLPNETGGILIGSYDMQRKIIYVVDTILSPSDSEEWPFSYIRGANGLNNKLENVRRKTLRMLEYIGEWHSHPKEYHTKPSTEDKKSFQWISENMQLDGHPPLMMIAGDEDTFSWYIEHIG